MALRPHRAGPLLQPARLLRACCPPALAVLWLLVATVGRGEIVWQSVAVPNGNFELGGTGASTWGDGGLAGLSNSANDYGGDVAIDVLTGWQFGAGSVSRGLMDSGNRANDPVLNGTRGVVANIRYNQGSRGNAAGYLTSEAIPDITIPASGGQFKMEVSHYVTNQARGVNFGFMYGSLSNPMDVTQNAYGGDATSDKWGTPYELNAGHNTRHEGATSDWITTRIYWDNTGTFDETFGLTSGINKYNGNTEGYAAETVDGVYTIRYYTNKRGANESLRLGAFVRTNSAGGTGNLYLDDFKLWVPYVEPPPPPPPASQEWYGGDNFRGGDGTWSMTSETWRSTIAPPSEPLVEGAMAVFPQFEGPVTIAAEGVTVSGGMTFEAVTFYSLSGGTLTLGGATTPKNTIDVNSQAITSISAPIAGTAGLNKAGPGELILSAGGTLSGNVMVAAGTLRVAHASALGTADVFVSGGTLAVDATASLGAVTVDLGGQLVLDLNYTRTLSVASLTLDSTTLPSIIDLGAGRIEIAPIPTVDEPSLAALRTSLRTAILAGRGPDPDLLWTGSQGILSSVASWDPVARTVGYRVEDDGSAVIAFAAPGDVNLDGIVDTLDMVAMMSARKYGTGLEAGWSDGDFNYDGVADYSDLEAMAFSGAWGIGNYLPYPEIPFAPVPEPAAVPLLAAAAFGLAAACRRLRG